MIFSRRVIEVVKEVSYGTDPGGSGLFPVYPQGDEVPVLNASRAEAQPSTRAYGAGPGRFHGFGAEVNPLRTYLLTEQHHAWIPLLEAAGFRQVGGEQWAAVPSPDHTSLTVRHYLAGVKQTITGVRANLAIRAFAGGPISVDAILSAAKVQEALSPVPKGTLPVSSLPRFCNARCIITVDGEAPFSPRGLEDVGIETGTILAAKAMSKASGGLKWRIQNVVPQFRCQFEEREGRRWRDFCNRPMAVTITLGGWRWDFPVLTMAELPASVRLSSGLAGVALVMREVADLDRPVTVTWVGM